MTPGAQLDQRDAELALLVGQAGEPGRDRRGDDRLHREMRRAHRQVEVADRRAIGGDDMDVDAEPVGMEPQRLLDAVRAVERVERGWAWSTMRPSGSIESRPAIEQVVDIVLLDPVPAELDLDRGDVAGQPPAREADPDMLEIDSPAMRSACSTASRTASVRGHVGDIAAPDAPARRAGRCRARSARRCRCSSAISAQISERADVDGAVITLPDARPCAIRGLTVAHRCRRLPAWGGLAAAAAAAIGVAPSSGTRK